MQAVTITQITPPELAALIEDTLKRILVIKQEPQQEADQLLTIQEAGELLSLAIPTLYGLVSRSQIPALKKGKRLYFSKQELTDWIKQGRKSTTTDAANNADAFLTTKRRKA